MLEPVNTARQDKKVLSLLSLWTTVGRYKRGPSGGQAPASRRLESGVGEKPKPKGGRATWPNARTQQTEEHDAEAPHPTQPEQCER